LQTQHTLVAGNYLHRMKDHVKIVYSCSTISLR